MARTDIKLSWNPISNNEKGLINRMKNPAIYRACSEKLFLPKISEAQNTVSIALALITEGGKPVIKAYIHSRIMINKGFSQ